MVSDIHIYHADSLAGPMKACKEAFEKVNGARVHLISGRSKDLAERIRIGNACDVALFSDPSVIQKDLIEKGLASWYIVFSANQLVLITGKGNELNVSSVSDLCKEDIQLVRVTGETDLATYRTIECLNRASKVFGEEGMAERIMERTAVHAGTIPEAVRSVKEGRANAGIVYLSAALAHRNDLHIVHLPETMNLSDQIRNAMTIPATAQNRTMAKNFSKFILSEQGKEILQKTGQPPRPKNI